MKTSINSNKITNFMLSSQTELNTFNLSQVQLLKSPFYKAQQTDLNYILALKPDRLLAPFLIDAGFNPVEERYENWESTGLDGHIGGHYLSALSMMYASTGDTVLLRRINYMIDWLKKCQEKNGNGYVGGIPNGQEMWEEIRKGVIDSGNFSLNNRWVPLYNIHKLFAGLRDVYLFTENKTSLDILIGLSDWFYDLLKNLTDNQIQEMLKSEHGGLNEVIADVYEITGDEKYLDLSIRLSHKAILAPLLKRENKLTGLHANTQIPKVIGFKKIADLANKEDWEKASEFFWNTIVDKWTISIGGNSVREHFHPTDDFSSMVESNQGPETCNTYNMLRLTKMLFLKNPKKKYIEYYERALFNHILSSQHPGGEGGFVYFTPMRPRHYRVYSQAQQCFWCCVGSGLENHSKYGELIYAHDENDIYVNLFIPSVLNWKEKGIKLTQESNFPSANEIHFTVETSKKTKFGIKIRKPDWVVNQGFEVNVNDEKIDLDAEDGLYININRLWNNGDKIYLKLTMKTYLEYMPDSSAWVSIIHGPLVLAAKTDTTNLDGLRAAGSRMGHVASGPFYSLDKAPIIVTENKNFTEKIVPVPNKPLTYRFNGILYPKQYNHEIELIPFFEIHDARYMIYWPYATKEELNAKIEKIKAEETEKMELEEKTIDQVATGEQQPETEHNFKGEETEADVFKNRHWRQARGWFCYDLTDAQKRAKYLRITYNGLDKNRTFDILINDELIETVSLNGSKGDAFVDVDYEIPNDIVKNSNGVYNVKFKAHENSIAGGIYYIRLLKE